MNIQDLGSLGELIAAIATVATLVYLAKQLYANTKATVSSNRYEITRDYVRFSEQLANPELQRAWTKGLQNYPNMKEDEAGQFANLFSMQALMFQGIFAQYDSGQLDEETYLAYLNFFTSLAATPGGGVWWEQSARPVFVPSMVAAVDEHMSSGNYPELLHGFRPGAHNADA